MSMSNIDVHAFVSEKPTANGKVEDSNTRGKVPVEDENGVKVMTPDNDSQTQDSTAQHSTAQHNLSKEKARQTKTRQDRDKTETRQRQDRDKTNYKSKTRQRQKKTR